MRLHLSQRFAYKSWQDTKCFSWVGMLLICMLSIHESHCQNMASDRNYLSEGLRLANFQLHLKDVQQWRASQKKEYRQKIGELPDSIKSILVTRADKALPFSWPALPASSFLEFKQNGNRIRYEAKLNERRDALTSLVIGYLITGDKKYLPQLINGLWATLEESTWEIPAIVALQKAGRNLPDPTEEIVGLVSAETAVNIAMIQFMLSDELEQYSSIINQRIEKELYKKIFEPYLQRSDYWWMGFKGEAVNNWNAWINTNVFQTALLAANNADTLTRLMQKVFSSTDYFINQYPEDGGCDEGPSYWNEAGGKLIRLLFLANRVSQGQLDWSDKILLNRMGSYIYKMHIAGEYFVNFADAVPQMIPDAESVYRYGEMFDNDSLKQFGTYLFQLSGNKLPDKSVVNFLQTTAVFDKLTTTGNNAVSPSYSFLPDLEIATIHSGIGKAIDLLLSVQGGHNGESHNHNDVGNFILYACGKPVIVDAGVGTYTAQTFSKERYALWNMQSQWHNCPTINGVMQQEGKSFRASNFSFQTTKNKGATIDVDIAKAYPSAAFVKKWHRQFVVRQQKIVLKEDYELIKVKDDTKIHFLSYCMPKEDKKDVIGFYDSQGKRVLSLKYDPENMKPVIELKELDDAKMIAGWGDRLYRLTFLVTKKAMKGKTQFEFSK